MAVRGVARGRRATADRVQKLNPVEPRRKRGKAVAEGLGLKLDLAGSGPT